jgi:hypothetical protein
VNHYKPCGLGVASHQSLLMIRLPRHLGSTLVLRINQETIHDFILFSCHHAVRTWPHQSPGPSNQAYLSSPFLEAHWHGPFTRVLHLHRPIKTQSTPALLSQESVHITLSTTHHTRKRSSPSSNHTGSHPHWRNNDPLHTTIAKPGNESGTPSQAQGSTVEFPY